MLSLDCSGCGKRKLCTQRYITVKKGEFVYCDDGSKHLVDINSEWIKH